MLIPEVYDQVAILSCTLVGYMCTWALDRICINRMHIDKDRNRRNSNQPARKTAILGRPIRRAWP